jgi:hypothetical protein
MNLALALAASGASLAVLGSLVPRAVLPVYLALMALAFPRRDALCLRKPQTDSYWARRRHRADPLSYYRQA